MLLYHGTHRDNVESILKHGLWGGGDYDPSHLHVRESDDAYAGATPAGLAEFVSMFFAESLPTLDDLEKIVILEIDVTGIPLRDGWDGEGTYTCYQTVEPSRIRVLSDEETWAVGACVSVEYSPAWR